MIKELKSKISWYSEEAIYLPALILFIANSICVHLIVRLEHKTMDGPQSEIESQLSQYRQFMLANKLLFWIGIWLSKVAFLLFYYRLFGAMFYRIAWWLVFLFTVATIAMPIADSFVTCKLGTVLDECRSPLNGSSACEAGLTRRQMHAV